MLRTKITSVLADGILAPPHLKGQGEKLLHGGGEGKRGESERDGEREGARAREKEMKGEKEWW